MSYGWLTESSLIPKPGKKIDVNKHSLSGLQAILARQQEARASVPSARRPTKARVSRDEALLVARNEGIEARNISDEDLRRRKMEEKTRKYEEQQEQIASTSKQAANAPEDKEFEQDRSRKFGEPITFDDEDEEEVCPHGIGSWVGARLESESDEDDNDGMIGFPGKRKVGWGAECSIAQRRKAAGLDPPSEPGSDDE